jgi:origin recognition complex subunit 4
MATRERPHLDPHDFFDARLRQAADAKVAMLLSASALELCLVIAARQLAQRGAPAANFEQIYDTYRRFAAGLQREALDFYQKPVAQKAFEHLCDMELFRPADGRAYPVTDVFRPMQLMLTSQQLTETIDKCSTLASRVKIWAKSNGL